jgi:hypothetical protein
MKSIEFYLIIHYFFKLFEGIVSEAMYKLLESIFNDLSLMLSPIKINELKLLGERWFRNLKQLQDSEFFGEENCTKNFHVMKHLPFLVYTHGPLAVNSLFMFESFNSNLTKNFVVHNSFFSSLNFFNYKQVASMYSNNYNLYVCNGIIVQKSDYLLKKSEIINFNNYTKQSYSIITNEGNNQTKFRDNLNQIEFYDNLNNFLPAVRLFISGNNILFKPLINFSFMFV